MFDLVPIALFVILQASLVLFTGGRVNRLASDVRAVGKTILITGCNRGIGRSTALGLARRGASVIMACRNIESASKVADEIKRETGNADITVIQLDLSSFASIKKAVKEINDKHEKIDVLINNAGLIAKSDERKITEDGNEVHFQTNHLGPFLLTMLLLPKLKASSPSRIINVSSDDHRASPAIDLDDVNFEYNKYSPFTCYCVTKLENILFTKHLARKLADSGVTVNCLHPGTVETDLINNKAFSDYFFQWSGPFKRVWLKTEEEGAQTSIYCALEPSLSNVTGTYFDNCREREVHYLASNPESVQKLWDVSTQMTANHLGSDYQEKA